MPFYSNDSLEVVTTAFANATQTLLRLGEHKNHSADQLEKCTNVAKKADQLTGYAVDYGVQLHNVSDTAHNILEVCSFGIVSEIERSFINRDILKKRTASLQFLFVALLPTKQST